VYSPPSPTIRFVAGAFSPNGETFAALSATVLPSLLVTENNRLVMVSLAAGSSTTVQRSDIDGSGNVAWSRDGNHIVFTGYQPGPGNVTEVRTFSRVEHGAILRTVDVPEAHGTAIAAG
jgi:Tol biopolymer transport system component